MADVVQANLSKYLAGGGEMGALMRAHDWSHTPLGSSENWPQALKTVIRLMLNTGHPVFVFWGPQSISLYNDAYARTMGPAKHPWALGQPSQAVWAEIWDTIGPQIEQVMAGGEATWYENQLLSIRRNGGFEDTYWTYSYSPIDDDTVAGGVGGVLVLVTETTEEMKIRRRAEEEAYRFSQFFQQAPTFMVTLRGPEHRFEFVNPAYISITGPRDLVGLTVAEALPDAARQGYVTLLDGVYQTGEPYVATSAKYATQPQPDGPIKELYLDFIYQPIKELSGAVTGIFVVGYDVTNSVNAVFRKEALAGLTVKLQTMHDLVDIAYAGSETVGTVLGVSRVGYGSIGMTGDDLTVKCDWTAPGVNSAAGILNLRDFGSFVDDMRRGKDVAIADVTLDPRTRMAADTLIAWHARSFVNVAVIEHTQVVAVFFVNSDEARDWSEEDLALIKEVSQRIRTAIERQRAETSLAVLAASLEEQVEARTADLFRAEEALRQSQKMEAVGQLTGGIAHDFNNLLAGITGSLELLQTRVQQGRVGELTRYIDAATGAAQRAASLTQRLLAFSRRQTLDPKPIDVNRLAAGMEDLVRRTVGPQITVEVMAAVGLWNTLADAGQLENSLLNLCINARDAMEKGGHITIATANTSLDDRSARDHELPPGQYVTLSVRDTGTGMTQDVIDRAFDPFFTTKAIGVGTGLGLSMVYGFARQTGGQVRIYSQVGQGTTMYIYLPRCQGQAPVEMAADTQKEVAVPSRTFALTNAVCHCS